MIYQNPAFVRAAKRLPAETRTALNAKVALLASSFGRPHLHRGLGIRPFGRYLEFRVELKTRALFLPLDGALVLIYVGSHDQCRTYLRNNR